MTRLGLIARFDEGGLGTLTWEAARHLQPDLVMLVSVPPARGEEHLDRYQQFEQLFAYHEDPDPAVWERFVAGCDVIYSAETFYFPRLPEMCARAGVRLVLHAMPELYDYLKPTFDVWAPTDWMRSRLPTDPAGIVPVPVDRQRCARRNVTEVRTVYHPSAPAMLDRNGTELVKNALKDCTVEFRLLVLGPNRPPEPIQIGKVEVLPVLPARDYWAVYEEADALVLPRRYGGLSLPMQEAASCGLPIVSLNVDPQKRWLHPFLSVPATRQTSARMKGGQVNVWQCHPPLLAQRLDALVSCDPTEGVAASEAFAHSIDWERWAGIYRRLLGCAD